MKWVHVLWVIIGILVLLMLGCFLLFGVCFGICGIEDVYDEVNNLYNNRVLSGLFGLFFLWGGYEGVKALMKRSARDEVFIAENENGRTSVSVFAIEDFIKKTLRKKDEIRKIRVKVRVQDKTLKVPVRVVLRPIEDSHDFVKHLQDSLIFKLTKFVGIGRNSIDLTVKVVKIEQERDNTKDSDEPSVKDKDE